MWCNDETGPRGTEMMLSLPTFSQFLGDLSQQEIEIGANWEPGSPTCCELNSRDSFQRFDLLLLLTPVAGNSEPQGCKYWQRGSVSVIYFLTSTHVGFVFVHVPFLFPSFLFHLFQSALKSKSIVPAAYRTCGAPDDVQQWEVPFRRGVWMLSGDHFTLFSALHASHNVL